MSIRKKIPQVLNRRSHRLRIGLVVFALTAGQLALVPSALAATPKVVAAPAAVAAVAATVPAAPAGSTLTWSDDFNGAAGSALDTATWRYDAGLGANFGTGEIETTTTSTANVYQDGSGHLVLKALHSGTDPNTGWTSGRVETQADGFGAVADRRPVAGFGRDRRDGGHQRPQLGVRHPALRDASDRTVQRVHRHRKR
jgi:hypothetical protein